MQNKLKNYKPLFYAVLITLGILFLVKLMSANESFTHEFYPKFYKSFYPMYSSLFGWIPFSVGDLIYAILILAFCISIGVIIRCMLLGQKWRGIYIISRIIIWVGVLYFIFHLIWGFNYYKPSLNEVYNGENYTLIELKEIANDLLLKSNFNRSQVKEDKNGVFQYNRSNFKNENPNRLKDSSLFYSKIPTKAKIKFSLFSLPMRYFGVSGYYNPFSGEAQIIRLIPDPSTPFSMAHEQAHQMGYATENEANFIGYVTCVQSNSNELKYSANYKALKYVLREVYPYDSAFVHAKLKEFSSGMERDYEAEKQYNQKYAGKADKIFSVMNDAYLKANNQEGLQSYNNFVELLVGYYRKNGLVKEPNLD